MMRVSMKAETLHHNVPTLVHALPASVGQRRQASARRRRVPSPGEARAGSPPLAEARGLRLVFGDWREARSYRPRRSPARATAAKWVFLRGIRCVQRERQLGGSIDTATVFRGACAISLA